MLLVLLFALATSARGALCIDGNCAPATGTRFEVRAADAPRPFVWSAADGSRAVAGVLVAGEKWIDVAENAAPRLRFEVRTSDGAVNVPLTVELGDGAQSWRWNIERVPAKTLEITHAACDCTIVVRAADYRAFEKKLARSMNVERIVLQRLPVLSGIVRDAAAGAPLGGARILRRDGETLATTGADGRFRVAVDGPWPASIEVVQPGLAPRIVEVPRIVADTELPPIALTRGGSIRASIAPLRPDQERLSWEMRRDTRLAGQEILRRGELTAEAPAIVIDGIDPGSYRLVLRGERPLQQYGTLVQVADSEVANVDLRLEPALLELEVRHGGQPLSAASVELEHLGERWRGMVTADDEGVVTEEVWQQGDFELLVGREPVVTAWLGERTIRGEGRLRVTVDIPKRRIAGRVLDAATNQPIEGAVVTLETSSPRGNPVLSTKTSADGAFSFAGVPSGRQSITAYSKGYRGGRSITFTLAEEDGDWTRDLLLDRLVGRAAVVVNARGLPVAGATVLLMTAEGVRDAGRTDGEGKVTLPLASSNERGVVFALPRSGSFGWSRLRGEVEETFTVRVPDGSATLEVLTQTTSGTPIPRVGVAMRVDGMIVPREVMDAMTNVQGIALLTDAAGRLVYPRLPPGRYELWPVLSREDLMQIYSPMAPPPGAEVTLVAGPQTAVMTFTRP